MANYVYQVMTPSGKEQKGKITADSKEAAQNSLKSDGSIILSIKEETVLDKDISFSFGRKKVKSRDLGVFCKQFNSILSAGVSVVAALEMLCDQTEDKVLKGALSNVRNNVEKGDSLATAMKKEQAVFPSLLINMIEAGEASGSLEVALIRMSTHFEKDARLKGMVKKAMMYPIILIIVAIAVMVLMLTKILPMFTSMFEEAGTKMPGFTQFMIDASDLLIERWYVFVTVIVAIVVSYKIFAKTDTGAHLLAKIAVKAPVFGNLTTKTAAARFARNFSTLIAAGMPMMDALDITAATMTNLLFKEALYDLRDQVSLGSSISTTLKNGNLFPSMICHMIGIGEETGNLEDMLDSCADYYDEEVELATQSVTALMEPMVIIFMAVIIGSIVIAIYLPMMSMYDAIG
ncbi:MAG: type II secretion system F family protein [Lachnospiraceae bacterium]|nr:type II secretion system F family protein [Lachnospiraceae bacterium]